MKLPLALFFFFATLASADTIPREACTRALVPLPLVAQTTDFTCGAACLRSLLLHFLGAAPSEGTLAYWLHTYQNGGTLPEDILRVSRALDFKAEIAERQSLAHVLGYLRAGEGLIAAITLEGIPHWVAVRAVDEERVELMDPWVARDGRFHLMDRREFTKHWLATWGPFLYQRFLLRISPYDLQRNVRLQL